MKAEDIELAVAKHFDWRKFAIIPNISWGMGIQQEGDLWVVNPKTLLVTEIEIKISGADIKLDAKKGVRYGRTGYSWHMEGPVRRLFFAVPEELINHPDLPQRAGLIAIKEYSPGKFKATRVRESEVRKEAPALTQAQYLHFLHLGSMRVWGLKEKLNKLERKS